MKAVKLRLMVLLVLVCVIAGCGYTFQGGGSILPPDVKRVYIPRVENNSTEIQLGSLLTEALRDRFERYGAVAVVDETGEADAVLNAKIMSVKRRAGSVTSNTDTELQVDTTVNVAAELRRTSGPLLWRNANIAVTRTFGSEASAVVTTSPEFAGGTIGAGDLAALQQGGTREVARGQESEAFSSMAEEVARTIYESAVSPDF